MTSTFRDPTAKPGTYRGIQMRSGLEVSVAQALDEFGVRWAYEAPAPINGYLPDFTIVEAREELELPRWVEVKPAQLLYDTRDRFGIREDLGGDDVVVNATAESLQERHIAELHKPQRLAFLTGEWVLVVSALNRNRTLSILCEGTRLLFSKWQPAVNWKAVVRDRERAEERAKWQAEAAARDAAWRSEQQIKQQQRASAVRRLVTEYRPIMAARYPSACLSCGETKTPDEIALYRPDDRWLPVCLRCIDMHKAARQ